jgi:hypothetical protein
LLVFHSFQVVWSLEEVDHIHDSRIVFSFLTSLSLLQYFHECLKAIKRANLAASTDLDAPSLDQLSQCVS